MIRLLDSQNTGINEWIEVQPRRYRYRVLRDDGYRVQIVCSNYLTAEVAWD
jgi:hypothetical protein